MNQVVQDTIAARYEDLEAYLRHHYHVHGEVLAHVLFKAVEKVLTQQDRWVPARASVWTWVILIARGVAAQELVRLAHRAETLNRAAMSWKGQFRHAPDPLELLLCEERACQAVETWETQERAKSRSRGASRSRRRARAGGTPS